MNKTNTRTFLDFCIPYLVRWRTEEYYENTEREIFSAWLDNEQYLYVTLGYDRTRLCIWNISWYDVCKIYGIVSRSCNPFGEK